jgi:hypothetical protein
MDLDIPPKIAARESNVEPTMSGSEVPQKKKRGRPKSTTKRDSSGPIPGSLVPIDPVGLIKGQLDSQLAKNAGVVGVKLTLTPEEHRVIKIAATIVGQTISTYTKVATVKAARDYLRELAKEFSEESSE